MRGMGRSLVAALVGWGILCGGVMAQVQTQGQAQARNSQTVEEDATCLAWLFLVFMGDPKPRMEGDPEPVVSEIRRVHQNRWSERSPKIASWMAQHCTLEDKELGEQATSKAMTVEKRWGEAYELAHPLDDKDRHDPAALKRYHDQMEASYLDELEQVCKPLVQRAEAAPVLSRAVVKQRLAECEAAAKAAK